MGLLACGQLPLPQLSGFRVLMGCASFHIFRRVGQRCGPLHSAKLCLGSELAADQENIYLWACTYLWAMQKRLRLSSLALSACHSMYCPFSRRRRSHAGRISSFITCNDNHYKTFLARLTAQALACPQNLLIHHLKRQL